TAAIALGVTACGGGDQPSTTTEASTTGSSTGAAPTTTHQGAQPGPTPKEKGAGHKESARDRSRHHPAKAAVSAAEPARLDPAHVGEELRSGRARRGHGRDRLRRQPRAVDRGRRRVPASGGRTLAVLQAEHGAVPRDRRGRHPADRPRPAEVIVSYR